MRPLYALLVWVVILGGLFAYTTARDNFTRPETPPREIEPAPGNYELELTPTFDAISTVDDFAVTPTTKPAIVAKLNAREIVRFTNEAPAGIPQRFTWNTRDIPVLVENNQLYLELAAPPADAEAFRGVRVRLLRDKAPVADEMLWSQPGAPVSGAVAFDVAITTTDDQTHGHDN